MIKKLFNKLFKKKCAEISFKQGFELTDLAITTMYQNGKRYNFLLDTGSADNIIDSNILSELQHTPLDEKSAIYGIDGIEKEVGACNITFTYEGKDFPYLYLVNDMKAPFTELRKSTGVIVHGIVGAKFFHAYKYVLDFSELKAYCKC